MTTLSPQEVARPRAALPFFLSYGTIPLAFLGAFAGGLWVIALPVGYTLGRTHLWGEPMGPQGFWIAFVVGVSVAAVCLFTRVHVLERRLGAGKAAFRTIS